jgi:hypothetical protein
VFKLIKLIISVAALGVFVWWGLTVPLGDRTLFEHVTAIGQSKESQELVRGTKQKVGDLTKRMAVGDSTQAKSDKSDERGKKDEAQAPATKPAEPQERLTNADRKEIRSFIDTARAKVSAKPN